jgi:hypothetical protein
MTGPPFCGVQRSARELRFPLEIEFLLIRVCLVSARVLCDHGVLSTMCRAVSNGHSEAQLKPNMTPDAHSSISASACVGQLKALSSDVLLHGGIRDRGYWKCYGARGSRQEVPLIDLSILPGIVINCCLLAGPIKPS